ncbi:fatty acyl-AMP ligase [Phytohabitans rumicis]|uniref:Polyketide synthase n=1 Tax=Phytohabitans rumicis TaxID=1076125 RepID=A0A6V8KY74_9ACTN|nr:fatty acyl-AMP ligase [Phytohabitans rumicis]GFJ86756.1 polyketide synthase [Phytohabitans rumicis]
MSEQDFVSLLTVRAVTHPDRPALVFDPDPGGTGAVRSLSYAQVDQRARRIAALLRRSLRPGDRVLVLDEPGLSFAENFLGALYAGMIAVPAPLPDGYKRQRARLAGIARDSGTAAVLTDAASAAAVAAWADESGLAIACLPTDELELPPAGEWQRPDLDPTTVAFLQYTSGSTSDPKGVRVDHGNILSNVGAFQRLTGLAEHDAIGGWLPMYHDFGLIGQLLVPLYIGGRSVVMSPTAFLKRPHTWLQLIDRHDIVLSPAPNFAYDLCTRRITDEQLAGIDLSRWRHAVNGSEPIQARTLRAFRDRFSAAGLRPEAVRPGYGMAETTLCVTGSEPDLPPQISTVDADLLERHVFAPVRGAGGHAATRDLVSSGVTVPEFDIRIVDPATGREQQADRIGEIWIRGRSVARGYWNKPEQTQAAFGNTVAGGDGDFLRTGDLGIVHEGRLYVTGRIKELLIVNGRNLYPHDVEADVRTAHDSLSRGTGAAFTVEVPHEELVVVHECRARQLTAAQLGEVVAAVRQLLAREYGVGAASVALVRSGAVPRTTSGKIQRRLARELFLTGALDIEYEEVTALVREQCRRPALETVPARARVADRPGA